ncbi:MAG: NUDIX hydrolase [Bacteroidota bacterium]
MNRNQRILEEVKKLKAITETGLVYCENEYDIDRYKELHEMSLRLMSELTEHPVETLKMQLPMSADYPTAKVDVRCMILSGQKEVLLVQESLDGKWSLPGGWADIGSSPRETAIKECKEETGLDVVPETLLAVLDKKMHAHPPQAFYVYKLFFHCRATSAELKKGFDALDVKYFSIDNLPELSEDRILKSQIEMMHQKIMTHDLVTVFD